MDLLHCEHYALLEEERALAVPLPLPSNSKPSYVLFYPTEYHQIAISDLPPNLLFTTNHVYLRKLQSVSTCAAQNR